MTGSNQGCVMFLIHIVVIPRIIPPAKYLSSIFLPVYIIIYNIDMKHNVITTPYYVNQLSYFEKFSFLLIGRFGKIVARWSRGVNIRHRFHQVQILTILVIGGDGWRMQWDVIRLMVGISTSAGVNGRRCPMEIC